MKFYTLISYSADERKFGGFKGDFQRCRSASEGEGLIVNIEKTTMMVSDTEGEIALSKIDLCGIYGKWVCVNVMQCVAHCVLNGCVGDVPK